MLFILASSSSRRKQMFRDLSVAFTVTEPQILEKRLRGEPAVVFVRRIALEKAKHVIHGLKLIEKKEDWCVLAADTTVVLQDKILGKPRSTIDAAHMLEALSGKSHEVITAYCWLGAHKGRTVELCKHVRTKVEFSERPKEFWKWYVATGEPMDKAGAYAAQGIGMSFIKSVQGSYSNVVGLPLSQVLEDFKSSFGVQLYDICGKL